MSLLEIQKFSRLILVTVVLSLNLSCAPKSKQSQSPNQSELNKQPVASTPPFQTREPARYQAVRTVTSTTASGESVTRETIAKDGTKRREESYLPSGLTRVYLENVDGRFLLIPELRIYAALTDEEMDSKLTADEVARLEATPDQLLHAEPVASRYQRVGNENVSGRNCAKYRVLVNTGGTNNVSDGETLIWIDESLGMPIKSEATSTAGTRTTMELSEISFDVDEKLFSIPRDYERVKPEIIRSRLNAPK